MPAGGRAAGGAGEFTQRAFYFGRIDLAQAEAAADLINAQTAEAAQAAVQQLGGRLSREVERLRQALAAVLAHLEAQLDFGEDDIDPLPREELAERLAQLSDELARLLATAEQGKLLRQGARVALAGRPNVGKSSLMNALLGEERVIVTPVPGTTRDTVAESLNIHGVPVVLVDTAGLREAEDEVEQAEWIAPVRRWRRRTWCCWCWTGRGADRRGRGPARGRAPSGTVVVLNKCDLEGKLDVDRGSWNVGRGGGWVEVSAKTHEGLDRLREAVAERIGVAGMRPAGDVIVTNVRHQQALARAGEAVSRAQASAAQGATEEYLAEDLRSALEALGEIVGATSREEIISEIFARFCVGK